MAQAPTNRLTPTALAGATLLLAASLARLPSPLAVLELPPTPFHRSSKHLEPAFVLLTYAREVIPRGSLVTVTSEPANPVLDIHTHHMAVALLPGRTVLPAALWGGPRPDLAAAADYVVIVGARPQTFAGDLLLERREGTVWRRKP